jgi:hypothetical protein
MSGALAEEAARADDRDARIRAEGFRAGAEQASALPDPCSHPRRYAMSDDTPDPCTDDAIAAGCTCRLDGHPSDPDTSVRLNRDCPLHGEDPDYALEAMRDAAVHLRNIDTMESERS